MPTIEDIIKEQKKLFIEGRKNCKNTDKERDKQYLQAIDLVGELYSILVGHSNYTVCCTIGLLAVICDILNPTSKVFLETIIATIKIRIKEPEIIFDNETVN